MSFFDPTLRAVVPGRAHRLPQMMLFAGFAAWYFGAGALATSAANGLAFRFRLVAGRGLVEACFHLFLLLIGFVVLQGMARHRLSLVDLTALPRRASAQREWLLGAAVGWGIVVGSLLPLVLLGKFHARIDFGAAQARDTVLSLITIGIAVLAHEITFRGFPFRCLTRAVGPSLAVVLMVLGSGISAWQHAWISGTGVLASMLLTGLLSMTWLRTHAVWLAWGLHFSLVACVSLLFGLPVRDGAAFLALVHGSVHGPDWLTGGVAGPVGSVFSLAALIAGILVLYRATRDYAWNYTHSSIVAGGDAVYVAPPAAHVAMEEQAAKPPKLVQILTTVPTNFSAATPDSEVSRQRTPEQPS